MTSVAKWEEQRAADLELVANARAANPTEDALALSFCEAQPALRFVSRWNRWMQWDGVRWCEDDTLAVFDAVRQHVRRMVGNEKDGASLTRAQSIAAIEKLTKSDRRYAATTDQWDRNDWLLNTPGGIVDLRTGELTQADPAEYLTKVTSVAPGGDCPAWLCFLEDVTGGDEDFAAFLQRVAGYAATGSTAEHAMFFLYGAGGNGKGTFLNTLSRILGDYTAVSSMETFTESKSDRHPTDLAMLRGARLVLAQETEEGRAWAESKIKSLTGGDPITARYMRQDFFTFEPKFKLLIAGNHKPSLRNIDEAIRRRLHLLPFEQSFTQGRCDTGLPDRLMAEAGGILQWIIDGCLQYQRYGLAPPRAVSDATAEYFAAENIFEQWLQDVCNVAPELWDTPGRLFASWKRYAEAAHERVGTQKLLAERLAGAGFKSGNTRTKGGRHWNGLRVRFEDSESQW